MTKDAISIDIETLGTTPGDVILSIGAVKFDPTAGIQSYEDLVTDYIKISIDMKDSIKDGFKVDADTLMWWLSQSREAQQATFVKDGVTPGQSCYELYDWITKAGAIPLSFYKVWSNGANFDAPMTEAYFKKLEMPIPWKYGNVRCYRTITKLFDYNELLVPPNRIKHDCLSDAVYQAQVLQAIVAYNPGLEKKISK